MARSLPGHVRVLTIQDNPADESLFLHAWGGDPDISIASLPSGTSTIDYIRTFDEVIPGIVLLAGRNPENQMTIVSLLRALKAAVPLRHVPVIILSGCLDKGLTRCFYDHQAACVLQIPAELEMLRGLLEITKSFWLRAAQLPTAPSYGGRTQL